MPIFKIKHLFIFLIIISALFGVKALFHSGFYTSHDGRHQIIRLMHFHQGLVDGQMPVRWAGTALWGYGYPLFIFTYRLPFWLAEGWYLFSKNLGDSIKFVFVITYICSGLSMFWFASGLWRSKFAGFLSAILYLYAPYRFSNIFVRAALGEAVTFVFIPLIYLGLLMLSKKGKNNILWVILTVLAFAGLILSHLMTLGLWLIPIFLWWLLVSWQTKKKNAYFLSILEVGLITVFVTAYYWFPAALERKFTRFSGTITNYYQTHFVTFKQLLYSKWGYGFDMPGTNDDMMSFQVGFAQWLVIIISVFIILKFFVNKKKKFLTSTFLLIIYFLIIFIFSIFLMLPPSKYIYEITNKYFTLDIPWRFLAIAVFSSSVLFGKVIILTKNKPLKIGIALIILFLAFYGNRNHLKVNQYVYNPESEYWQSAETSNQYDDYAPRWFGGKANQNDPDIVTFDGLSRNKLLVRKSNFFRFYSEVESSKAQIVTKISFYPGWQVFIDGKKQNIDQLDGKIRVKLDQGNHLITLVFRETRLRLFCNWLSLLTLLSIIILVFKDVIKKKQA